MEYSIVEIIQAMLAPGLMISACGLFLLGMNNKYSLLVNRIRLLNEEKRTLECSEQSDMDHKRLKSLNRQISKLYLRFKLVRNAVFSYSVAVAFFIMSSLLIGYKYINRSSNPGTVAIFLFLMGILSVLIGIVFAAFEVWRGYRIVKIEVTGK